MLKTIKTAWMFMFYLMVLFAQSALGSAPGEIKVSYSFREAGIIDCQMALTRDSVGLLQIDSIAGSLEPDDENDFADLKRKRALTSTEEETAEILLTLTRKWSGLKRFSCVKNDGYAFSIWTDSLTLHCNNCFSCSDGMGVQEAKILARFGKLTLWLYSLREDIP